MWSKLNSEALASRSYVNERLHSSAVSQVESWRLLMQNFREHFPEWWWRLTSRCCFHCVVLSLRFGQQQNHTANYLHSDPSDLSIKTRQRSNTNTMYLGRSCSSSTSIGRFLLVETGCVLYSTQQNQITSDSLPVKLWPTSCLHLIL